jgi:hypothetical protein
MNKDEVIRELVVAVEYLRGACEHSEGATVLDTEALTLAMSVGIRVSHKYGDLVPDYQRESFWAEVRGLPDRLGVE